MQDAGETLVVATNAKGAVNALKIRYGGRELWVISDEAVAVENPNGGTSAGVIEHLEKVEDKKKR
ncbi:hypothetical protein LVJ94_04175 [Pendulispora rubella]|uniref:Uncharacterized protein n=1 Tax=Pendulispora rubella TaxID=2741070 RepID=A0ABZ2L677_9BACT